jgi:hypothetical protein
MNTVKRLALLALIACTYSVNRVAGVHSSDMTYETTDDLGTQIAHATQLVSKYFFSPDLLVTPAAKQLAYLTHEVSFIQLNGDSVSVCRFDYLRGSATMTKYKKEGSELTPIRSEQYSGAADGGTKCISKGRGARKVQLQEKLARGFRATVKKEALTQVKFVDLYTSFVPLWIQAESAEDIRSFIDCVQEDLIDAAIDPSVRTQDGKPLCIITLKNDLFLDTISPTLWKDLRSAYNMTTFADSELRKYIWNTKKSLAETISGAANEEFPSFWAELFEDLSRENYGFSFKKGARKFLSDVVSVKNIIAFALAAIGGGLVLKAGKYLNDKWENRVSALEQKAKAKLRADVIELRVRNDKSAQKDVLQSLNITTGISFKDGKPELTA